MSEWMPEQSELDQQVIALHERFEAAMEEVRKRHEAEVDAYHDSIDAIDDAHPLVDKPSKLFAPPKDPVAVECYHCRQRYSSNEIVYERRLRYRVNSILAGVDAVKTMGGMWWCRNYECDGAGFGHNLHEVKDRRVKLSATKGGGE